MVAKVSEFLSQVKLELQKVTWPSKKDTTASTTVVIVLVMISAVFLWGVDFVLSRLIQLVLG